MTNSGRNKSGREAVEEYYCLLLLNNLGNPKKGHSLNHSQLGECHCKKDKVKSTYCVSNSDGGKIICPNAQHMKMSW